MRKDGFNLVEEIKVREKDLQRQWETDKIAKAKNNREYNKVKIEGNGSEYLRIKNLRKNVGMEIE